MEFHNSKFSATIGKNIFIPVLCLTNVQCCACYSNTKHICYTIYILHGIQCTVYRYSILYITMWQIVCSNSIFQDSRSCHYLCISRFRNVNDVNKKTSRYIDDAWRLVIAHFEFLFHYLFVY